MDLLPLLLQACIAGTLTKGNDDEGPCPKCKKPVELDDLTPIGGGSGGDGGSTATGGVVKVAPKLDAMGGLSVRFLPSPLLFDNSSRGSAVGHGLKERPRTTPRLSKPSAKEPTLNVYYLVEQVPRSVSHRLPAYSSLMPWCWQEADVTL